MVIIFLLIQTTDDSVAKDEVSDDVTLTSDETLFQSCGRLTIHDYTHFSGDHLRTHEQYEVMECFIEHISVCEPTVLPITVLSSQTYTYTSDTYLVVEGLSDDNTCSVTVHGALNDVARTCGMACLLYDTLEDRSTNDEFFDAVKATACDYPVDILQKFATQAQEEDRLLQLVQLFLISSFAESFTDQQNNEIDLQCSEHVNYSVPTYQDPQGIRSDYKPVPYSQVIDSSMYQSCGTLHTADLEKEEFPQEVNDVLACFFESLQTCNTKKLTLSLQAPGNQNLQIYTFVEGLKFGGCEIGTSFPDENFNKSCIYPQVTISNLLDDQSKTATNDMFAKVFEFIMNSLDAGNFDDSSTGHEIHLTCFER